MDLANKHDRMSIVLYAVWGVTCLPLTDSLNYEVEGNVVFYYMITASPIWINISWEWVYKEKISFSLMAIIVTAGILIALSLYDSYSHRDMTPIALLVTIAFLTFSCLRRRRYNK